MRIFWRRRLPVAMFAVSLFPLLEPIRKLGLFDDCCIVRDGSGYYFYSQPKKGMPVSYE